MLGARRAAIEEFSPWAPGRGQVAFTIFPGDFETNGPHRLVLQTRIRTAGLTDSWEIEPPHVPFNFEFDPILRLDAILTLPDATRDDLVARAIRLEPGTPAAAKPRLISHLGDEWTLRNPPQLAVATPLPCDLAHAISIEFEGIADRFPAGRLLVSGQGLPRQHSTDARSRRPPLRAGPGRATAAGIDRAPRPAADADLARSRPSTAAGPTPTFARSGPARPRPTGSTSRSCRRAELHAVRLFRAEMIVPVKNQSIGFRDQLSPLSSPRGRSPGLA